jgi:hypothetical protein
LGQKQPFLFLNDFPVFFRWNRELPCGEWFAGDCVLRHSVSEDLELAKLLARAVLRHKAADKGAAGAMVREKSSSGARLAGRTAQ